MKKNILIFLSCLSLLFLFSLFYWHDTPQQVVKNEQKNSKKCILVSIAPHKHFVEKIAGDTVHVLLLVPSGASPHTFEPKPKEMMRAQEAELWLTCGEPFEARLLSVLRSYRPELAVIDTLEGIHLQPFDTISGGCYGHHHEEGKHMHLDQLDRHVWLSPRLAKVQAETIGKKLIEHYPEHAALYAERLAMFVEELEALDREIGQLAEQNPHVRYLLVSHPAFGYFCKDYHLTQLSVEQEGRDPQPQQLTQLLEKVWQSPIQCVYLQGQYNNKGAKLIADKLHVPTAILDPYAENYVDNLRLIAQRIYHSRQVLE